MERWPLWRGYRCGEVAVVERWPLWRGGRCREVHGLLKEAKSNGKL